MKKDHTHPDAWSIRRAQSARRRKSSQMFPEREKTALQPSSFGLISGYAAAKVDTAQQPGRRQAAGIGSPVCAAPTSALLAPLVHTGGRTALSQALSLRTRNPLSQSGVTQEDRSCWWVGRSAATKRGRRPVLPQTDRPGAQFQREQYRRGLCALIEVGPGTRESL